MAPATIAVEPLDNIAERLSTTNGSESTTNESATQAPIKAANGHDTNPGQDHLHVVDSRTSKTYDIPISDHFILGTDLGKITCPAESQPGAESGSAPERPLGMLDPGFQHTACKESGITHM